MLTENEIRPEGLMAEYERLFARDISMMMKNRQYFERVPCPACGSEDNTPVFEKHEMPFVVCDGCETLFANPRPRQNHLEDFLHHSRHYKYWCKHIFPASEAARREKIFLPKVDMIFATCDRFNIPTNTLLEVGAGFGIFCQEVIKTGRFKRVISVEPVPALAEACRNKGIPVIEKFIEMVEPHEIAANEQPVDVIANFEVIEHLFSPRKFLIQCCDLLAPGGILALTCPNSKGFAMTVLGERSSAVGLEHLNLFHPKSLGDLMVSCGFQILDIKTPGTLDAELVRKQLLTGNLDPAANPFLKHLLIDEWGEKGKSFQHFLSDNGLSSNMFIVGRKLSAETISS